MAECTLQVVLSASRGLSVTADQRQSASSAQCLSYRSLRQPIDNPRRFPSKSGLKNGRRPLPLEDQLIAGGSHAKAIRLLAPYHPNRLSCGPPLDQNLPKAEVGEVDFFPTSVQLAAPRVTIRLREDSSLSSRIKELFKDMIQQPQCDLVCLRFIWCYHPQDPDLPVFDLPRPNWAMAMGSFFKHATLSMRHLTGAAWNACQQPS